MIQKFLLKPYKIRLEYELDNINIKNLEEYNIGSNIGCELTDFYKNLIEVTIGEKVTVTGNEISDGKYEVAFLMANGKEYSSISKAWYTREYVFDTVMEVILDYLVDVWEQRKIDIFNSRNIEMCY